MKTRRKKDFDAIAESRKWREKTGNLLIKMSPAERIAFINRRIADLPLNRSGKQTAAA